MITLNNNNLEITEGNTTPNSGKMLSSPSVTPEMDDNMDKTTTHEDECYDCLDEYETELLNHNNKTYCKDCLEWKFYTRKGMALAKNIIGGK